MKSINRVNHNYDGDVYKKHTNANLLVATEDIWSGQMMTSLKENHIVSHWKIQKP